MGAQHLIVDVGVDLVQLAARLARYTGNATYADWANKMYDWMSSQPMIVPNGNAINVFDGTSTTNNCSDADKGEWTYNYGMMISAASIMQVHPFLDFSTGMR